MGHAAADEPSVFPFPRESLKGFAKQGIKTEEVSAYAVPVPPYVQRRPQSYAVGGRQPLNPASVAKVFTTGLALDQLLPTYRFKTGFHAESDPLDGVLRGPLYIKGSGDPGFTTSDLWYSLRMLRSKGVKTIRGNVVLDDSVFSDQGVQLTSDDTEAFDEAPHRAYHAQPYGLLMNHGSMMIYLELNQNSVRVVPEEAPQSWAFVSEVQAVGGGCGAWKNGMEVGFARRGSDVVVTVKGSYPRACGTSPLPIRVPPQDWLWESWFREIWAQLGGEFSGQVVKGKTPANTVALYTFYGKQLAEHIKQVNKWSSNVMARHLELAVAGSPQLFNTKMLQWLNAQGIDTRDWYFENGSGLSRSTRIDAQGLTQFLRNMAQRADFPDYLSSFPRAGADGTLRSRMKEVDGYAYLKTGSLNGVRSIGGYLRDKDGQLWAVGVMVKSPNAAESWAGMEGMLEFLYRGR